jgi:hypothetical protein
MLPLDSPKWSDLRHAYGAASDVPKLIEQLRALPPDAGAEAEPYSSLWSSLCHQDTVYTASYAAVPLIVELMAAAPERVPETVFQLVACIEIARGQGRGPDIPADLVADYFAALTRLPALVAGASKVKWDQGFCQVALAAVAVSKGFWSLADAVLELDEETIEDLFHMKFGDDE